MVRKGVNDACTPDSSGSSISPSLAEEAASPAIVSGYSRSFESVRLLLMGRRWGLVVGPGRIGG